MAQNSNTNPESGDPIAVLDQMGTEFENIAGIFGSYYAKLKATGVPTDLATAMTMDVHTLYWTSRFAYCQVMYQQNADPNLDDF
jgi:hypothetical protein